MRNHNSYSMIYTEYSVQYICTDNSMHWISYKSTTEVDGYNYPTNDERGKRETPFQLKQLKHTLEIDVLSELRNNV